MSGVREVKTITEDEYVELISPEAASEDLAPDPGQSDDVRGGLNPQPLPPGIRRL